MKKILAAVGFELGPDSSTRQMEFVTYAWWVVLTILKVLLNTTIWILLSQISNQFSNIPTLNRQHVSETTCH